MPLFREAPLCCGWNFSSYVTGSLCYHSPPPILRLQTCSTKAQKGNSSGFPKYLVAVSQLSQVCRCSIKIAPDKMSSRLGTQLWSNKTCVHISISENLQYHKDSVIWIFFPKHEKKMQKLFFVSPQVMDNKASGQVWPLGLISAASVHIAF